MLNVFENTVSALNRWLLVVLDAQNSERKSTCYVFASFLVFVEKEKRRVKAQRV